MSVLIDGSPDAPLLIIGMAPGKTELAEGAPFVGPSGALLWSALSGTGLSRADCYIINCIGELPAGEKPSPAQLGKYWDSVNEALKASRAKVMLLLGGDALQRILGPTYNILPWRGYMIPSRDFPKLLVKPTVTTSILKSGPRKGQTREKVERKAVPAAFPPAILWAVPTLHPAAVIRDGYRSTPAFFWDVQRAARLATSTPKAAPEVPDPEAVTFDIENHIVEGRFGPLHRIGLGHGSTVVSLRWDSEARQSAEVLADTSLLKVGFNLAHDVTHLHAAGADVEGPYYDVMLACQLLQPDLPKSLNYCASLYLDTERWKHLNESNPALYNRLDVRKTQDLWATVDPLLDETGQRRVFQTEMEALPALIDLRERGILVDKVARGRIEEVLRYQANTHLRVFQQFYPGVNPRSSTQMIKALKLKGYNVPKAEGKETADAAAIESVVRSNPTDIGLRALLDYRDAAKSLEYLLVPLWEDGRVHPNYLPASKDDKDQETGKGIAGTGRLQARDPNIQQVPKIIREVYIPDSSAHCFIELDFQQAELRVAAALSGDVALQHAIDGPDLHGVHAKAWGCTRDEAKTLVYASLYGAGPHKLQRTFSRNGNPRKLAECHALLTRLYESYPALKAWREELVGELSRSRRLVNPFGRQRYFWHPAKDTPAGLDFFPQSTVADIVWDRIPFVADRCRHFGGRLTALVHDSFLVQVNKRFRLDAAKALKEVLESPYDNIAPGFYLPVSIKAGPNWRHLEET